MPPLDADLGRPELPCLLGAVGDLLQREEVGVRVVAALRERAEPAPDVADVGEVDVAVDHVGHGVADALGADRVRCGDEVGEVRSLRGQQVQRLGLVRRRAGLRAAQDRGDLGVGTARGADAAPGQRLGGDQLRVAVDVGGVEAERAVAAQPRDAVAGAGGGPAVVVARGACRVGVLPGLAGRHDVSGEALGVGEGEHRAAHAAADPRVGLAHVLRVQGQALDQAVAGRGDLLPPARPGAATGTPG